MRSMLNFRKIFKVMRKKDENIFDNYPELWYNAEYGRELPPWLANQMTAEEVIQYSYYKRICPRVLSKKCDRELEREREVRL